MDFLPGITELYLAAEDSLEFTPPISRNRKIHQVTKGKPPDAERIPP